MQRHAGTAAISSQQITITDATAWAAIYYTTDGVTRPTINSAQYTGPILSPMETTHSS
ncbi:chitobiase/beta-hexosaminidase C-terminal domain-containing protein [Tunturiibacter gelidiferens]|uniref:chitobiase/beta-hexosaminidase C-terminal domain-containing protein n=1 Tax=Tunturiibacter gelidiferens TaxID=3069689 RepID=UPI003D9BBAE6